MRELLATGLGQSDLAQFIIRLVVGGFFILARFRWVYDPSRPQGSRLLCRIRQFTLRKRLATCGYSGHPFLAAMVAVTEILAGAFIVLGFLTVPSAAALVIVMCFATRCTAKDEVTAMNPVDRVDVLSKYLFLCEPLYLLLCIQLVLVGAGSYSLDALLWR